ncbi:MAG: formate/nitrite transporter family protein, partial [Bacilli bacterium]|nr:formate/nitrite transporter family protein [Bacilli bacterium]
IRRGEEDGIQVVLDVFPRYLDGFEPPLVDGQFGLHRIDLAKEAEFTLQQSRINNENIKIGMSLLIRLLRLIDPIIKGSAILNAAWFIHTHDYRTKGRRPSWHEIAKNRQNRLESFSYSCTIIVIARREIMIKKMLLSFTKGILAGLSIGLGGFLYVLMTFLISGEVGKMLGSVLFAIGLFLVCTFRLDLYTGKIGLIFERKQESSFYVSLPVMLLGNAVGAISLGYACFALFGGLPLMESALATSSSRVALESFPDYLSLCLRSFLCGFCVYMAVKLFGKDRLRPKGILFLVFFVFLFVYCGFQHCIANMFYLGFGNAFGNPLAYANLGLCILFNSFGPIMGVLLFKLLKTE